MSDPFNCPGCGSHDYGMYGPTFGFCPWCAKYENGSLRSENADLRHDIERHVKIAADQATELADLRAKLEEVRKDAERWRYRINCEYETSCSSTAISREEWIASRTAAIDAAIAQGKA